MRILFDAYWLPHGVISGRRVVEEVISAWSAAFPRDELFVASPAAGELSGVPDGVRQVKTHLRLHPAINAVELPFLAKRHGVDWILAQNFSPLAGPSAVFLHDVLFQSNPEWFSTIEKAYFRAMIWTLPCADKVFTSSENESRRIASFNPRVRTPIAVGLGVSSKLSESVPMQPEIDIEPAQFVLAVGRLNVRKNLGRLVVGALRSQCLNRRLPMVVVGESSGVGESMSEEVRKAASDGSVVFTGRVSEAELRWLYENCKLMCYVALDEGFGLPPVEAMHFGAPVLVSDIPVMHENLGAYATYVNPRSVEDISSAFKECLGTMGPAPGVRAVDHDWSSMVRKLRHGLDMTATG
ncbi:glycosyltransferase family 4 protein [Kocuria sp. CH-021]|uniref:glycosyltransferase family 4 protein n=1 Tax=Kocuria sp. CH-021 TaxID=3406735 RepID=UPI003C713037